ncbi:MAG: hypothetical protein Q9216_003916 [Gyalolechia sp. 2 TL-2023]
MPLAVEPCTDADIERVFDIISDTFQHTAPFIEALFPRHDTPKGREAGRNRLLEQKHTDPSIRFIKVVDTDTRQIIGQANWQVLEEIPTDESLEGDFWENENDKEFAQRLHDQYMIPRSRAIKTAGGKLLGRFQSPPALQGEWQRLIGNPI